jgi:murein DD-endopeptidase MepM/ murein hydrolase activator NlpD
MLHRVVKGETLSSIGRYYRRDAALLAWLNDLEPPYRIGEGAYLYVPPDNSSVVVRSGVMSLSDIRRARAARAPGSGEASGGSPHRVATPMKTTVKTAELAKARVPKRLGAFFRRGRKTDRKGDIEEKSRTGSRDARPRESDGAASPPPGNGGWFDWPVEGDCVRGFSSLWPNVHKGTDIAAPKGTPIRAARGGKVLASERRPAYGNVVVIDHGDGFSTVYAHNSESLVKVGSRVTRGETIARVGETGNASGPHLHFELRYKAKTGNEAKAIDPKPYLPPFPRATRVANKAVP